MTFVSPWPYVYLAADVVAVTYQAPSRTLSLLSIRRAQEPYAGLWAFPGGFVEPEETTSAAAIRELAEETGLRLPTGHVHELGTYSAPGRDPRHRVVTVAYTTALASRAQVVAGDDAAEAEWCTVDQLQGRGMAFDHSVVLADAMRWWAHRAQSILVAPDFLGTTFSIAEARRLYETLWGCALDAGNFQRKLLSVPGLLKDSGQRCAHERGRPAVLYNLGSTNEISPAVSRPLG